MAESTLPSAAKDQLGSLYRPLAPLVEQTQELVGPEESILAIRVAALGRRSVRSALLVVTDRRCLIATRRGFRRAIAVEAVPFSSVTKVAIVEESDRYLLMRLLVVGRL